MNIQSDVNTLEGLMEDLPESFLMCRDLRHAWEVSRDFYVYDDPKSTRVLMIARELTCLRCQSERREVFAQRRWGIEKIRNTYTYVDGYQLRGVPRGVKASAVVQDVQYRKAMKKVAEIQRQAERAQA